MKYLEKYLKIIPDSECKATNKKTITNSNLLSNIIETSNDNNKLLSNNLDKFTNKDLNEKQSEDYNTGPSNIKSRSILSFDDVEDSINITLNNSPVKNNHLNKSNINDNKNKNDTKGFLDYLISFILKITSSPVKINNHTFNYIPRYELLCNVFDISS